MYCIVCKSLVCFTCTTNGRGVDYHDLTSPQWQLIPGNSTLVIRYIRSKNSLFLDTMLTKFTTDYISILTSHSGYKFKTVRDFLDRKCTKILFTEFFSLLQRISLAKVQSNLDLSSSQSYWPTWFNATKRLRYCFQSCDPRWCADMLDPILFYVTFYLTRPANFPLSGLGGSLCQGRTSN